MLVAFSFCASFWSSMKIYEIDGERFSTLEEFYGEIDRVMRIAPWGHNLNAFNDILRGGFGTPGEGFTIRWKNHKVSQERLAHPVDAELGEAQTAFDCLLEIIRTHGTGGREEADGVKLILD
jgi:RNAse (barnase) inhibitor barstar